MTGVSVVSALFSWCLRFSAPLLRVYCVPWAGGDVRHLPPHPRPESPPTASPFSLSFSRGPRCFAKYPRPSDWTGEGAEKKTRPTFAASTPTGQRDVTTTSCTPSSARKICPTPAGQNRRRASWREKSLTPATSTVDGSESENKEPTDGRISSPRHRRRL